MSTDTTDGFVDHMVQNGIPHAFEPGFSVVDGKLIHDGITRIAVSPPLAPRQEKPVQAPNRLFGVEINEQGEAI